MTRYCFINGEYLPTDQATVGINDIGLLRSYAVFDYLRTYNGRPFGLQDYIQRFRNSGASLRLELDYTNEEIEAILKILLEKSGLEDAAFRFLLTGGYTTDSMSLGNPNFIIVTEKLPKYPAHIYQDGIKLITYEYQREVATSKTTDYLNAIWLDPMKKEANAFDILYYTEEDVLEVTRNNFFLVKDGKVITPNKKILMGITRKYVLELARKGYPVEERQEHPRELDTADEAFVTGSSKKIIPVVQIDDRKVGGGVPGPITKDLMERFDEMVNAINAVLKGNLYMSSDIAQQLALRNFSGDKSDLSPFESLSERELQTAIMIANGINASIAIGGT